MTKQVKLISASSFWFGLGLACSWIAANMSPNNLAPSNISTSKLLSIDSTSVDNQSFTYAMKNLSDSSEVQPVALLNSINSETDGASQWPATSGI